MRTMLGSLHGIPHGEPDRRHRGHAPGRRPVGLATAADPALEKLLPEEFLQLGIGTHRQFDELAAGIASGFPRDTVVARLARLTGNCVACHESHRLEVALTRRLPRRGRHVLWGHGSSPSAEATHAHGQPRGPHQAPASLD